MVNTEPSEQKLDNKWIKSKSRVDSLKLVTAVDLLHLLRVETVSDGSGRFGPFDLSHSFSWSV